MTCRVFHQKLQKIMDVLRQGLLGSKIYLLHVVEFQKRGLLHAHLALRVEPQPQTTDDIDQVVSAEVPPASDDDRTNSINFFVCSYASILSIFSLFEFIMQHIS